MLLYRRLRCGYAFSRIRLTKGQFAIVDPDDFLRLCRCSWYAVEGGATFYAVRTIRKEGRYHRVHMHREVLPVPDEMFVDHINGNGLDNRKANLRPATRTQNLRNRKKTRRSSRSRYKGLHWDKHWKQWRVRICVNRIKIQLGLYDDEIEAAKAYDRAAIEHHGEFASLNFPESATKTPSHEARNTRDDRRLLTTNKHAYTKTGTAD